MTKRLLAKKSLRSNLIPKYSTAKSDKNFAYRKEDRNQYFYKKSDDEKSVCKNPLSKMSDTEKLQCRNLTTKIPPVNDSTKKNYGISFISNGKISYSKKSDEKSNGSGIKKF